MGSIPTRFRQPPAPHAARGTRGRRDPGSHLGSSDKETLTLSLDGARVVEVHRVDLRRLEVSRGEGDRGAAGAAAGALAGVGLMLGKIALDGGCYEDVGGCPVYFIGGAVAAAAGTLVGAIIGATVKTERWERVGPSVSLDLGPTRKKGVAVAVSVRF